MAKPKRGNSGGPKKNHGPKKHLFKFYKPMVKAFADCGILSKYYDYDAWTMACTSRGKKDTTRGEFNRFFMLSKEEKDNYFKNIHK